MPALPYRISGSGPTVVLIHGTAPDYFDALERELLSDHRVVRLERRGFGKSGLPAVRRLTPHARDIAEIADELGAVVLVGWSMGGLIALETALLREQSVRGLVLLEPPWAWRRRPTWPMLRALTSARLRRVIGGHEAGAGHFLRWVLSRRDGSCEFDEMAPSERARLRDSSLAMFREFDSGTGEHIAKRLKKPLRRPVRLLLGTDSLPEFETSATRLAKLLAIELQWIAGAGHLLQQTHAPVVAEAVRSITRA